MGGPLVEVLLEDELSKSERVGRGRVKGRGAGVQFCVYQAPRRRVLRELRGGLDADP